MTELNTLVHRRDQLKKQVTVCCNYGKWLCNIEDIMTAGVHGCMNYVKLDGGTEFIDKGRINYILLGMMDMGHLSYLKRKKVEEAFDEFGHVHSAITKIEPNKNENVMYAYDFNHLYYSAIRLIDQAMDVYDFAKRLCEYRFCETINSMLVYNAFAYEISNAKSLPKVSVTEINLPVFTGNREEWTTFHILFTIMVHSSKSLTDVQKLVYLKSALGGDALDTINCLDITEERYQVAWSKLTMRYYSEIYDSLISIYKLMPMETVSSMKLKLLTEQVIGFINALKTLNENPSKWGSVLVHLISTALDVETMNAWEKTFTSKNEPEIYELLQFLEKRITILKDAECEEKLNSMENKIKISSGCVFF